MNKKRIIFTCSGCNIGNSIDLSALQQSIASENKSCIYKSHSFLCGEEGLQLINYEIKTNSPDSIIIAACSSRVNCDKFIFDESILVDRVNFREQIAWSQKPNDEDTQMLAEDNLRMAIAKTNVISNPKPYLTDEFNSDILVIGGGITGITAAIEASKAGYKVILIEREEKLGGKMNLLHKQIPVKSPYLNPENNIIESKIVELKQCENVSVNISSKITEISGQPGEFFVKTITNDKESLIKVGAIVTAVGWNPYDAGKLSHLGYGNSPDIITNVEFEKMAKDGNIVKPSNQAIPQNILFIQCAGSRDEKHLKYCSNFCCLTSLKQVKYVIDSCSNTNVYVVYKDMRTPGQYEQFYKSIQNNDRVFLTKGDIQSVTTNDEQINVEVKNTLIGEDISIDVDLVVLATGMTPENTENLNLAYRQGKGLPTLKYEFTDSHFICFPYETRRTGIYTAGTCRAPMDVSSSMEDACGAALKAIQCVEASKEGKAVHPRSGDQSYPNLFLQRCTDCKRCTEECPFGAYDETEKGTPLLNPNRCRRCGICMGSCPERIISFEDYSIESVSAMIKSVHIPDEFEEKPRILAFVCENDAYPAFDMAGLKKIEYSAYLRVIPVRCIGSVNKIWITDALSHGFDGILLFGCKPGDDYQCHFIQGSELTHKRSENFQETLQTMMLEPERVQTEFIEINDYEKIPKLINDYIEEIELIGPNPFKSM